MFMKVSKFLLLLLVASSGFSTNASAALKWASSSGGKTSATDADSYMVKSYKFFTGTPSGTTYRYAQVVLKAADGSAAVVQGTNCSASDTSAVFVNSSTATSDQQTNLINMLATASATGWKIKLQYDDSSCTGSGHGAQMEGVEVIPE